MKITIELPETTTLSFVNYAFYNTKENVQSIGCLSIDTETLRNGFASVSDEILEVGSWE